MYSLLPHTGPVGVETVRAGYELNDPVLAYDVSAETGGSDRSDAMGPLLEVDAPNVVIETVKRAEDGAGLIVRLYDSLRSRRQVTLRAAFEVAAAYRTNLLEERAGEEPLAVSGREVTLLVRPFEIVTLRLVPRGNWEP